MTLEEFKNMKTNEKVTILKSGNFNGKTGVFISAYGSKDAVVRVEDIDYVFSYTKLKRQ